VGGGADVEQPAPLHDPFRTDPDVRRELAL